MRPTSARPTLLELRQLIHAIEDTHCRERRSFSLFPEGFPVGTVAEITGVGKTEFIAQFLCEIPTGKVAWLEAQVSVNPYGLFQSQIALERILFIECAQDPLWSLQQILSSQIFSFVIVAGFAFAEKELRKFQLLLERASAHLFVLHDTQKSSNSWVPAYHLRVQRADQGDLKIEVLRKRGVL